MGWSTSCKDPVSWITALLGLGYEFLWGSQKDPKDFLKIQKQQGRGRKQKLCHLPQTLPNTPALLLSLGPISSDNKNLSKFVLKFKIHSYCLDS